MNSYQRITRAFKQAPWRLQMQVAASIAAGLTIVFLLGLLFLSQAARTATTGREVQRLEKEKMELARKNAEQRAELAGLRSYYRMQERARALGFLPALPEQVEYLVVDGYPGPQPVNMVVDPPAAIPSVGAAPTPEPDFQQTLFDWLTGTLFGIKAEASGGTPR